ncbi:unnamed protein product [Vitrella brassicaformis CCMP3155]|uniref:DUF4110 domain-containing protein n=4 Tax=Vitrella brassicaformis TaxID=1169539 RepID=A0A0G4GGQ0_VITBC|nr:unnamed protein product [Vitrella brassicaformis CCMP3155]|eukprot:CEM28812.1 unnamed protein product [Vitrella brassicaformis CCMP3155]
MGKKKEAGSKAAKDAKKQKQQAKAQKKRQKELGGDDDEDLDAILAELDAQEAKKNAITVTPCDQPGPRTGASLTLIPSGELVLFGGEYYDGQRPRVYNDLYKWNVEKGEWRRVEGAGPKPRVSHQTVLFKDDLYVFGGEFCTLYEFHHFRDLWRFDCKANAWSVVETTGTSPSPRSGHRMVVWRNFLVLFGGFYETVRETKYFNDLYYLNLQNLQWTKVEYGPHEQVPAPRSGTLMCLYPGGDCLYIYGGYSKNRDAGKIHQDCWMLNLKPLAGGGGRPHWERVGKKGNPPSIRASASSVVHKNLAIVFGGVYDEDDGGLSMTSVYYNDLYAFDMERRRWYQLALRKKASDQADKKKKRTRKKAKDGASEVDESEAGDGGEEEEDDEEDDEIIRDDDDDLFVAKEGTFGYIDQFGKLVRIRIDDADLPPDLDAALEESKKADTQAAPTEGDTPSQQDTEPSTDQPTSPDTDENKGDEDQDEGEGEDGEGDEGDWVTNQLKPEVDTPLPRINAMLAMKGHTLYVYGGLVELGKREVTLDDCWALDLNKREKWECVLKGRLDEQTWLDESDDEDEEDEGDESDNGDEGDGETDDESQRAGKGKAGDIKSIREEMTKLKEQLNVDDLKTTPQLGENLRHFFERTRDHWTDLFIKEEAAKAEEASSSSSEPPPVRHHRDVKEIRREAFVLCEERYEALRPLLRRLAELEEEQNEWEAVEGKKAGAGAADRRKGGK